MCAKLRWKEVGGILTRKPTETDENMSVGVFPKAVLFEETDLQDREDKNRHQKP